MSTPEHRRVRVIFSGRVQGVGFRATAQQYALEQPVVGWVRNCPDRTVEMEAEGPPEAIDALLKSIHDFFGSFIRDVTVVDIPPTGRETRFEVKY